MPTAMAHISSAEREPSAPPNVPRSSFKLPALLITSDDTFDRNVWSPSRRSSSIVANGELRSSNSPRTAAPSGSLLAPQASGGSSLSSPKPATPTRFEDPLLTMPSFRRNGGSPIVDPASAAYAVGAATSGTVSPLVASPSFRASAASGNSFSARRSAIDFRRSVPGAAPFSPSAATSPGEALAPGRLGAALEPGQRHSLTRGNSDFGNLDLPGYATSFASSESGGPGLDDDERAADQNTSSAAVAAAAALEADAAAKAAAEATAGTATGLPSRRHSAVVLRNPSAAAVASRPGGISPAARVQMRTSEEEEFMQRLQLNRNSWRERPRGSSQGTGGGLSLGGGAPTSSGAAGPGEGGLQDQTHAALEQLRGELKSLSMRSITGSPAAAAAAAVAAAPSAGAVSAGVFSTGHARMSEVQASQLSPSRLALSHHTYGSGAAAQYLFPRSSAPHAGQEAHTHSQAHAAAAAQAEAAMATRVRAPAS